MTLHADTALRTLLNLRGRLALLEFDGESLRGNPLGDPSTRAVPVYLPPGYDPQAARRYPVLYYLHGYGGDARSNIAPRPWKENLVQRADRLITEQKMDPAIVVVVDGWTRLGGSQFINSIHNGDYATYITRDLTRAVDAECRTLAAPAGRGVFGHSSGGFGALHLAMRYPGVFGALASHSGDAYFPYATLPAFEKTRRQLARFADIAAFVADFSARENHPGDMFEAMMTLAYAAAYSPRAAQAYAIDLPFVMSTGEINEPVFARWLALDPVEDIRNGASAEALGALGLCFVDCGKRDEWSLDVGARLFAARARAAGVAVEHEEFDGGHSNIGFRFERSMPLMLEALKNLHQGDF